jgi:hypothetical protein
MFLYKKIYLINLIYQSSISANDKKSSTKTPLEAVNRALLEIFLERIQKIGIHLKLVFKRRTVRVTQKRQE